tara:strand:- start:599 stop:754 length:156 start_codon:yes stop_codon:yes gene_type:complete
MLALRLEALSERSMSRPNSMFRRILPTFLENQKAAPPNKTTKSMFGSTCMN